MSVVSTGTPQAGTPAATRLSAALPARPPAARPQRAGQEQPAPAPAVFGQAAERAAELPAGQPVVIGEPLAEAAVLGCVLRAGTDQARTVLGLLEGDCWSVPQHAHVAAAARALLALGEPVDPVTVLGQLRRQGTENARTASRDAGVLLVELCQAAPAVSNAGHYARIVLEHAYRRRVQAAALRLLQAAEVADLADLVDAEHTAVTRARHRAAGPGPPGALPPS